MSAESTMTALCQLTGWSAEQVLEYAELGQNPNPQVMSWLLELAGLFDEYQECRGVILYLPDLYRECDSNLERTKSALDTPPYNVFKPIELLGLGMMVPAVELARDTLDPRRVDLDRRNPFFTTTTPCHALPHIIHFCLGGGKGLIVAQRWEEHIARCKGCRDNATYLDYLRVMEDGD